MMEADRLVIAGRAVPEELAPAARGIGGVSSLVWGLVNAPEAGRRAHELLREVLRDAPRPPGVPPTVPPWVGPGFGGTLLRLFANRNMNTLDAVQVLHLLTGFGPWSAATLNMVGAGRKAPTGELVASCAVVLGMAVEDLAAMAGIDKPGPARRTDPATAEAVELIWEARSISAEHLQWLRRRLHEIRHEYDHIDQGWPLCHCALFRGGSAAAAGGGPG
ncbi:hypothetical protein [Dactylosporangium sp. CA-139066]|uniref:hypothetical protein n=1 Tax=Dactylosporangium sp. CA-139066 TaxID=3239930 RepID=UPI003D9016B9